MKRITTLLMVLMFIFSTGTQAFGAEKTNASNWAAPSMEAALAEGFIPAEYLSNAKKNITRLEFCKMVVLFYEKAMGVKLEPQGVSPFTDTKDAAVIVAYESGLISGVTKTEFGPQGNITREQVALMLTRLLNACGMSLSQTEGASPFRDIAILYASSAQAINQLYDTGILVGDGNGKFSPMRQLTVQEAVASLMKVFSYYNASQNEDVPETNTEKTTSPVLPEQTTPKVEEKPVVEDTPVEAPVNASIGTVTIGGKAVSLGQSVEEIIKVWGTPDRIDETVYGLKRYVYIGDYKTYFFVTVEDNKSVEIFVPGTQFEHMGNKGVGTVVDIKGLTRISEAEHSAMVLGAEVQARIPLDFEGNMSGILLQTNNFATKAQLKSGLHRSLLESVEAELMDFIQVKRTEAGLPLLTKDERLVGVALEHSKDMVKKGYVGYNGLDGSTPFSRISGRAIGFTTASEVIVKKRGDTVNIYQEWVKTTAAIGGILDVTMESCGIGVDQKNQELYVTVDLCGGLKYL